ncbi:MAG: hypothetical protein AAFN78_11545 [Pseudomonadota bacterium]
MIDFDRNSDDAAMHRLLNQAGTGPSSAHDDAVLGAADRLLRSSPEARPRRWHVPAALAASLIIAVSVGLPNLQHVEQASPASAVRAAQAETAPPSGERLAALPEQLRWPAAADATGYRVVLRDATADVVWTSTVLVEPQLRLDGDAAAAVAGLETCIWSVEVVGPAEPQELGPYWFHLAHR